MSMPAAERGARRFFPPLVFAALLLCLLGWLLLRPRHGNAGTGAAPAAFMTLIAPRGELDAPPARFEWKPVEGAARYTVKIEDADALWPLFVRSTTSPLLSLTSAEIAALRPDRVHVWDVEALDERGAAIASGGTRFRIRPQASP